MDSMENGKCKMKNEFIEIKKICSINTGKLDSNAAKNNGKYPFFTCAPQPLKIDTYAFDDNVILIAGNNAGGKFHINRFNGKFNAYQRTYILTTNEDNDIDYIFYNLKILLQNLKKSSQGSQTKFLTKTILENIKIKKLQKLEQKKIARVLSVIDEKIEINKKINEKLEAMARDLYEYYFVQFDFPNENGEPYKSSGGEMVYSKELKREIPKGWEVVSLNEYFDFIKGIEPGKKEYFENWNSDLVPFYKVGDLDSQKTVVYVNKKYLNNCSCKENDILVSFDGTVGKVAVGLKGVYSSGIRKIKKKKKIEINKMLLLMIFKSFDIQNTIKKYATGSNILHASESIKYLKIPYEEKIYKLYNEQTKSIFEMLIQNQLQIQKLESLRDFLLPMLLNGQVKTMDNGKCK